MWLFYLFNGLLCLWMAYRDGQFVRLGQYHKIHHWKNGAIHIGVAAIMFFLYGWDHSVAILAESALVFDTAMNIFRKFNPFYIPLKPKSWKDKIEKIVFFNSGLAAKIFYLITSIVFGFKLWEYL
jgi:hypothetical protein